LFQAATRELFLIIWYNFTNGAADFILALANLGSHTLTISVDGINTDEIIDLTVYQDLFFEIEGTSTSNQTAGENSVINIINAKNQSGILTGPHNVIVTSDISGEGTNGEVYNGPVTFTESGSGNVIVNLETAITHILTVSIEGITPVRTHQIVVSAAEVSNMIITQQPAGGDGVITI
jgi:hypothetical protein